MARKTYTISIKDQDVIKFLDRQRKNRSAYAESLIAQDMLYQRRMRRMRKDDTTAFARSKKKWTSVDTEKFLRQWRVNN